MAEEAFGGASKLHPWASALVAVLERFLERGGLVEAANGLKSDWARLCKNAAFDKAGPAEVAALDGAAGELRNALIELGYFAPSAAAWTPSTALGVKMNLPLEERREALENDERDEEDPIATAVADGGDKVASVLWSALTTGLADLIHKLPAVAAQAPPSNTSTTTTISNSNDVSKGNEDGTHNGSSSKKAVGAKRKRDASQGGKSKRARTGGESTVGLTFEGGPVAELEEEAALDDGQVALTEDRSELGKKIDAARKGGKELWWWREGNANEIKVVQRGQGDHTVLPGASEALAPFVRSVVPPAIEQRLRVLEVGTGVSVNPRAAPGDMHRRLEVLERKLLELEDGLKEGSGAASEFSLAAAAKRVTGGAVSRPVDRGTGFGRGAGKTVPGGGGGGGGDGGNHEVVDLLDDDGAGVGTNHDSHARSREGGVASKTVPGSSSSGSGGTNSGSGDRNKKAGVSRKATPKVVSAVRMAPQAVSSKLSALREKLLARFPGGVKEEPQD